ncbi:gamma-glutamyl-gamma-aminobutyrate hydrolase family protein [Floridanema evergladense]|uniref:Gamma-glutamyl-gamma-aminobutyrate hydrolase family protein n=1 Tax=Floridaenema evergladense BLCC-F167 TaxID=3153639 RepID=A0ABV4WJ52_9CYAN
MKFNPPLIGVTTSIQSKTNSYCLRHEYITAVRLAGGLPMLIPPGEPNLNSILEWVDGIIFSGGGDLDPATYNGGEHPEIYNVNRERDRFELSLAKYALETDIPILGICRGLEVLVVASGGKLIPHLPDVFGEKVIHRQTQSCPVEHSINIIPGTHLAKIIGAGETTVFSWHHQAARNIPKGWRLAATAADGVIEALEHEEHPWAFAIQWHPEMSLNDKRQQRIFRAFINTAQQRQVMVSQQAS